MSRFSLLWKSRLHSDSSAYKPFHPRVSFGENNIAEWYSPPLTSSQLSNWSTDEQWPYRNRSMHSSLMSMPHPQQPLNRRRLASVGNSNPRHSTPTPLSQVRYQLYTSSQPLLQCVPLQGDIPSPGWVTYECAHCKRSSRIMSMRNLPSSPFWCKMNHVASYSFEHVPESSSIPGLYSICENREKGLEDFLRLTSLFTCTAGRGVSLVPGALAPVLQYAEVGRPGRSHHVQYDLNHTQGRHMGNSAQ